MHCAVLQGPLQSLTYLLNQGLLAATLGASWSMGVHWVVSVSTGAFVRVAGMMAYVLMSSWVMNENLFSVLMTNIYSLLVSCLSMAVWSGLCLQRFRKLHPDIIGSQSFLSNVLQVVTFDVRQGSLQHMKFCAVTPIPSDA